MKPIIYHHRDPDGIASAWLAEKLLDTECEFRDIDYHNPVPTTEDVINRDVFVVDFSFKRPDMLRIANSAKSILVIDHHKTAKAELEGLDYCIFDMKRCGTRLVVDELPKYRKCKSYEDICTENPNIPKIVDAVEDFDIWVWRNESSYAANAYLNSLPLTREAWETMSHESFDKILKLGDEVLNFETKKVNESFQYAQLIEFEGFKGVAINTRFAHSKTGNAILDNTNEDISFSLTWHHTNDNKIAMSVRSKDDTAIKIAKKHNGGGHDQAAGCASDKIEFTYLRPANMKQIKFEDMQYTLEGQDAIDRFIKTSAELVKGKCCINEAEPFCNTPFIEVEGYPNKFRLADNTWSALDTLPVSSKDLSLINERRI